MVPFAIGLHVKNIFDFNISVDRASSRRCNSCRLTVEIRLNWPCINQTWSFLVVTSVKFLLSCVFDCRATVLDLLELSVFLSLFTQVNCHESSNDQKKNCCC